MVIEHGDALVPATVSEKGEVQIAIGPISLEPSVVPTQHPEPMIDYEVCGYIGTAVSPGTTHFVTFVEELPTDQEINEAGPKIENHELFPKRTSIIFTKQTGERELSIRIWERGVGETLGCGTGSSSAAAVWMRKHQKSGQVVVRNPGGDLLIEAESWDGKLLSTSTPNEPFSGKIELDPTTF